VEGGEIIISGGVSAEVFDLSGKSVAVTTDGRVRGLEKGVYILRLADGRAVKVHVK
ncbi:MAG: T9SS type A sorting domain-containing protein, partial [Bacteroides sp.]|nr:T9SS type A sorting domain-containing protein [Bacteroides sp.]